ncbi:NAD(P)/FAD-dependent oxidoreductase [uncultured Phenylobacterium sp.]|uniref:flavin-containing monooxygenase n=1 Tax=uncultured Phenylobacterium sp. TaxID=349273 RepID=UPI0025EEFBA3|nr:NAD(P)/FAD-dependent oxidoreductase [uncultured Phenylobacterium sp.]
MRHALETTMDDAAPLKLDLDFDPDAIREKYRQERDKRVRDDGHLQYIQVEGEFAEYAEVDPYVLAEDVIERAPLTDEIDVAVIGGGFSGMLACARLKELGVTGIRLIEAGGDFGGTWYWNRYPGAQCDIESYCYLPLLEEVGYVPKEKYSYGTEIYEHSQRIGKAYGLYDLACFQTRVRELRWDAEIKRWHIITNRGDDMKARFVVMCLGTASRAKMPGIPGIHDFKGHSFHTSRWDYGYTGGDTNGGMTKLADKRIALIGTGATAIQCVPRTAQYAKELFVFQRTPSSVDYRGNKPTDPAWAKSLQPGWQQARRANFNDVFSGKPDVKDEIADGWTEIARTMMSLPKTEQPLTPKQMAELLELADMKKMNAIRARVDADVVKPDAAEALKPWYRQMCKRPTFNDEYLPAFNRDNVHLIDVAECKGVERITEKGVVANGKEYEVDCIIYSTGFEANGELRRRVGFDIYGVDGKSLYDHYEDGFRTLHGHSSHGFPNWFYVGISQNAISINITAMLDDQTKHIAYIISETMKRGATTVEATHEGEEAWVEVMRSMAGADGSFQRDCTPGYYNNEGITRDVPKNGGMYVLGINAFNKLLAEWREAGDLAGMELR